MAFEPLLERVGYKKSVFICSSIQIVAIISESPDPDAPGIVDT